MVDTFKIVRNCVAYSLLPRRGRLAAYCSFPIRSSVPEPPELWTQHLTPWRKVGTHVWSEQDPAAYIQRTCGKFICCLQGLRPSRSFATRAKQVLLSTLSNPPFPKLSTNLKYHCGKSSYFARENKKYINE